MEAVVNARRLFSKHGDAEVENKVLERGVLDEKVEREDLVLRPGKEVAEVWLISKVELWRSRAFKHENQVGHFDAHLVYFKAVFVWNELELALIGLNVLPPFLFGDELLLDWDAVVEP